MYARHRFFLNKRIFTKLIEGRNIMIAGGYPQTIIKDYLQHTWYCDFHRCADQ